MKAKKTRPEGLFNQIGRYSTSEYLMSNVNRFDVAAFRKQELINTILRVLQENKDGLTFLQVTTLVGTRIPKHMLSELQKEQLVRRKKGLSDGRLAFLYVLSKNAKIH